MTRTTETTRLRADPIPIALAVAAVALAALAAAVFAGRVGKGGLTWRALARAPVAGRIDEAVVWTGRELVVAGGLTRRSDGTSARMSDAAAYDPALGRWRRVASPPAGIGAGAVWTGHALVVWTGNGPDGPAVAAAYDPAANSWRRLPSGPLGSREGNANVWTGDELLVIGGYSGDRFATPIAGALNPATGRWRLLHGLYGLTLVGGPSGAVWDGREAIVAGMLSLCPERGTACGRSRPILAAYDPSTDRMRELKPPRSSLSLTPLARAGGDVIFRAWTPRSLRVLRYEPASDRWHVGAEAPCRLRHGSDTQTVWIGDRLVAPCGADGLQISDPTSGSRQWTTVTPGRSALNTRAASATAWSGRELIVWSGWAFRRFNPTPPDGASLRLRR